MYDWQATQRAMEAAGWVRTGEASYSTPEGAAKLNDPAYMADCKARWDYYFSLLDEEAKRGTNDSWKQVCA